MVGKNHLYAEQGRAYANSYADKVRALFKADADLQLQYDTQLSNGKWAHFMDQPHIGYTHWNNPPANTLPLLYERQPHNAADMGVAPEGSNSAWPLAAASVWPHTGTYELPRFDPLGQQERHIDVFNKGTASFKISAKTSAPWIKINYTSAQVESQIRLLVSIDWSKAPKGLATGKVHITGTGYGGASIKVSALNSGPVAKGFKGFIETDGAVVMEAEHFSKAIAAQGHTWEKIPQHGRALSSIMVFPVATKSFDLAQAPYVEYNFYQLSPSELLENSKIKVDAQFAPSWAFAPGRGLRYAVAIDDETPQVIDLVQDRSDAAWEESVRSEMRVGRSQHKTTTGAHRLRIYALDPGLVLQRVHINTGGLRPSYFGPPESPRQSH
jgi:hypothetical protein